MSSKNVRNVSFIFRKLIFYDLIDKRKPITGMGCLEFIMNQDQKYNLILCLIAQGVLNPEEIKKTVESLESNLFSKQ
mgnify:CR=1 FL=1